jgi:hypothetical protein
MVLFIVVLTILLYGVAGAAVGAGFYVRSRSHYDKGITASFAGIFWFISVWWLLGKMNIERLEENIRKSKALQARQEAEQREYLKALRDAERELR